jgi:hypothetical protein
MFTIREFANKVAQVTPKDADRYDQIAVIKRQLRDKGYELLSTDRETIDSILDVLYNEYGYEA